MNNKQIWNFTKRTRCGVLLCLLVDYESRKRDLQTRPTYECRSNERLKTKSEKSTRLVYTGLIGELEHLKIKTRLIDEMLTLQTLFNDVYYESIKWEFKIRTIYECRCDERLQTKVKEKTRPIYECRCDERLKTKSEKSTRLAYTLLYCLLWIKYTKLLFIINRESES